MTKEYQNITRKFVDGFEKFYTDLLAPYKDKEFNFLEIGVAEGGSLLFFQDLLPKAKIYGIDYIPCLTNALGGTDITTYVMNQNDTESLQKLATDIKFDIIIDDGAHLTAETQNTFDSLWSLLNPGGLYIIEDWAVCYHESFIAPNTIGMHDLVFDIAHKKNELGIAEFNIVVEENWCSHATYKKNK